MTHISKKKLDNEVLDRLFIQLTGMFKAASKKEAVSGFTDEFFTKSERIMFSKRLAAVLLLSKKVPQHVITDKLNMSPSTISKISLDIERGKFDWTLRIASMNKQKVSDILLEILLDGIPYPVGRKRRKWSMYRSNSKF
jgi:uncharacterized protein YerC